jgi:2Fe-2S ferredoxin
MITVNFFDHAGTQRQVEAPPGSSVMRAAVDNGVPGIDGDCGGNHQCGTCHVYVQAEWTRAAGVRNEHEEQLLELNADVRAESRLACQIVLDESLDGIAVRTPEYQQ